jgi:putative phage-type endonuclease
MKVIDAPQKSGDWLRARAGRVTASQMSKVIAKLKNGGEAAPRFNYRWQIVAELLTGAVHESYVSPEMEWGTETEALARAAYEIEHDCDIEQVGLVLHPENERMGASPDGLIGDKGCIEIKCPKSATHLQYLYAKVCPEEYIPQVQWVMACTERAWCDFVSFDPRVPKKLQMLTVRVPRDEAYIQCLYLEAQQFLAEVDAVIEQLGATELLHSKLRLQAVDAELADDPMGITSEDVAFAEREQRA